MEHIGIYLTDDSNSTFELPVNPAELKIKYETDDKSETIVKSGEINLIGDSKLKSISIESLIPIDFDEAHYTSASSFLGSAQAYIDRIVKIHESKKPLRMVFSGTKINLTATVSNFEYGFKDGYDGEYAYTLSLKEYKAIKVVKKAIKKNDPPKSTPPRPAPPKKIGVGSIVIVNGQLHRDSYGAGPGVVEQNATRKISFTAPNNNFPYHVSTLDGGWRGWVRKGDVRLK